MTEDDLDRALTSLKRTIALGDPISYGVRDNWNSMSREMEKIAEYEGQYAQSLPQQFILTDPINQDKSGDFAAAARAAKCPTKPLRPYQLEEEIQKKQKYRTDKKISTSDAMIFVRHLPKAKKSHMEGILHGIPGNASPVISTQSQAHQYENEMHDMITKKNKKHFRKRDAYSEYVEARARFSQMHNVK